MNFFLVFRSTQPHRTAALQRKDSAEELRSKSLLKLGPPDQSNQPKQNYGADNGQYQATQQAVGSDSNYSKQETSKQ
jgi:hypothetical protein